MRLRLPLTPTRALSASQSTAHAAAIVLLIVLASSLAPRAADLFDGHTLMGWEGDTGLWHVKDGLIVAGSPDRMQPHNEFLATTRRFTNFVLRLKVKLTGTEGFVNSGIQFRSERIPNDSEMKGYQADAGKGWWGALYDESRRNKVLARPTDEVASRAVKEGEWNDYEIRAEGRRIQLKINGIQTVDYTETDETLPQQGRIGLQIHGSGKTVVSFKDITVEELRD